MVKSRLGPYVSVQRRADGSDSVRYCAPAGVRPDHWPEYWPLPHSGNRAGSLSSQQFRNRVQVSIDAYDKQLEAHQERSKFDKTSLDRSILALAAHYRNDPGLRDPYHELAECSRKRNDRMIHLVTQWSEDRGHPSFATITRAELLELWELYSGTPSQQVQIRNILSLLMKSAINAGWRDDNPAKSIQWKEPTPRPRDLWSMDDAQAFFDASIKTGHRPIGAMIMVGMWVAQRLGDLRLLKYGHNYSNGLLRIRQNKTGALVQMPISHRVTGLIESSRVDGSDYVFTNPKTGTAYTDAQRNHEFEKIRSMVVAPGGKRLTMQALRHSSIVDQFAAGTGAFDIANVTGHDFQTMHKIFERYNLRNDDAAARAQKKLNAMRGGSDADFDGIDAGNAEWVEAADNRPGFVDGSERRQARQKLRRYLDADEVDALMSESDDATKPATGVSLARQF